MRVNVVHRGKTHVLELTLAQARDLRRVVEHHRRHGPALARTGHALASMALLKQDGRYHYERLRWRPTALGLLVVLELDELERRKRQLVLPFDDRRWSAGASSLRLELELADS